MSAIVVRNILYTKVPIEEKVRDLRPNVGSFDKVSDENVSPLVSGRIGAAVRDVFGRQPQVPWGRNTRVDMPFQVRGYIAIVDLTQCDVVVSSNRNHPIESQRYTASNQFPRNPAIYKDGDEKDKATKRDPANPKQDEVLPQRMVTTADWAIFNKLDLATNANFFYIPAGYPDIDKQQWTRTIGLSRSDGITDAKRTEPRLTNEQRKKREKSYDDACLLFDISGIASIYDANEEIPSEDKYPNGISGSWLLKDGKNPAGRITDQPSQTKSIRPTSFLSSSSSQSSVSTPSPSSSPAPTLPPAPAAPPPPPPPSGKPGKPSSNRGQKQNKGVIKTEDDWPLIPEADGFHARTAMGLLDGGKKLLILQFEKQVRLPTIATYNVAQVLNTDKRGHSKEAFNELADLIKNIGEEEKEVDLPKGFRNFVGKEHENILEGSYAVARKNESVKIDEKECFKAIIKPKGENLGFAFELVPYPIVDVWPTNYIGLANILRPPTFSTDDAGEKISGYVVRLVNPVSPNLPTWGEKGKPVGKTSLDNDGLNQLSEKGVDLSVGVTLDQLQELFLKLGVKDAINLDGSGSSAFVYAPDRIENPGKTDPKNARYVVSAHADWDKSKGRGTDIGNVNILRPRRSGNHIGFKIRDGKFNK